MDISVRSGYYVLAKDGPQSLRFAVMWYRDLRAPVVWISSQQPGTDPTLCICTRSSPPADQKTIEQARDIVSIITTNPCILYSGLPATHPVHSTGVIYARYSCR